LVLTPDIRPQTAIDGGIMEMADKPERLSSRRVSRRCMVV
jgi:hypothetical protein